MSTTTTTTTTVPCHVLTANGAAQHDTAQSKFGASSILFDGTGDYISIPDSTDWDFGTAPFTIDFWVRPNTLVSLDGFIASLQFGSPQNNGWGILVTGTDSVRFFTQDIDFNSGASTLTTGAWQHVAVTRSGDTFRIFIDGDLKNSNTTAITVNAAPNGTGITIGRLYNDSADRNYDGWMEGIRITKGVARWTANFTPPTVPPFPEANNVLVIDPEDTDGDTDFFDLSCNTIVTSTTTTTTTSTSTTTTTVTIPTSVIATTSWKMLNHGLVTQISAFLLKHDLPDFILRSWKLLNKSPLEKAFQIKNDILQTIFNTWQLINHSKIDATKAWLLENTIDAVDKATKAWNTRNQIGAIPITPSSIPTVDWNVQMIDNLGILVDITTQIEEVNIDFNEDAFVNTCELVFSDLNLHDQFAPISRDKTERIIVTIKGDVYKFLFEERDTNAEIVNRDFNFWGRSRPAILGKPYSDVVTEEFEPEGLASEIVARYTNAETIDLTFNINDYFIGANTLFTNEKTPLQIIQEISEAGGGIVRSDRANKLILREKYPDLNIINTLIPDHIFTDLTSIITLDQEELLSDGLNAVLVEGNIERINSLSGRFVLDTERNAGEDVRPIGTPMYVRLYLFPIARTVNGIPVANYPNSIYTIEISNGAMTYRGSVGQTVTREVVEIVQGEGSLEFPATAILNVDWLGVNIGTIATASPGDNLLTLTPNSNRTVGIAAITYLTEYDLYLTSGTDEAAVLAAAIKEL